MKMQRTLSFVAAATATAATWAHPGHGMPGESHWHAGDGATVFVVALIAGVAIWMMRGGSK